MPPILIVSCGVPSVVSTVTDSLKVTVAVTASSVLKAPSVPALLNAMELTVGPGGAVVPLTLWLAEAATASWSRTAFGLPSAVAFIVPPSRSSLFASMEIPSVSSSPAATVYPVNTSAVVPLPEL